MTPSAVVDSSIVLRWFVLDPWSDAAIAAADRYHLIAPAFLKVEIANALRSQVRFNSMSLDMALRHLEGLRSTVTLFDDDPLLPAALRLAADRDHAIYDCVYIALAMREAVPFVTADMKLFRKFADVPALQILTPETL